MGCSIIIAYSTKHTKRTWNELQMVKSQANTVELTLMVSSPNTHVRPSRGSNTTDAMNRALNWQGFHSKVELLVPWPECTNNTYAYFAAT